MGSGRCVRAEAKHPWIVVQSADPNACGAYARLPPIDKDSLPGYRLEREE